MVRAAAVLVVLAAVSGCAASPFAALRAAPVEVVRVAPAPRDTQALLADYWRERRTATPYLQPAFTGPETRAQYLDRWRADQNRFIPDETRVERKGLAAPIALRPAVGR